MWHEQHRAMWYYCKHVAEYDNHLNVYLSSAEKERITGDDCNGSRGRQRISELPSVKDNWRCRTCCETEVLQRRTQQKKSNHVTVPVNEGHAAAPIGCGIRNTSPATLSQYNIIQLCALIEKENSSESLHLFLILGGAINLWCCCAWKWDRCFHWSVLVRFMAVVSNGRLIQELSRPFPMNIARIIYLRRNIRG